MGTSGERPAAWLCAAGLVGTAHAAFSIHWAMGGTWLLDTVGATGDRLGSAGVAGTVALAAVGLVKAIVAWGPLLTRRWLGFAAGLARRLWFFAGLVLAIYGVVLTVVGLVALTGALGEPTDRTSLLGHALLWDPLFALWGGLMLRGLALAHAPRPSARRPVDAQPSVAGRDRDALVSAR
ncbi:MAG: DUF3995 domain-containing protein [Dermatophilaceae bacterium]